MIYEANCRLQSTCCGSDNIAYISTTDFRAFKALAPIYFHSIPCTNGKCNQLGQKTIQQNKSQMHFNAYVLCSIKFYFTGQINTSRK